MGGKGSFLAGLVCGAVASWLLFTSPGGESPDHVENLAAASPKTYEIASSMYRDGIIPPPNPYLTINQVVKKADKQYHTLEECLDELEKGLVNWDQLNSSRAILEELKRKSEQSGRDPTANQQLVDDAHSEYFKFLGTISLCL